jgi:3-isopropylmalate/(R)-2-methylmalate dehydratase large subunit
MAEFQVSAYLFGKRGGNDMQDVRLKGANVKKNLYEKVFDLHTVRKLPSGQYQLFIGLHMLNDITSHQGFGLLREKGLSVLYPERTFGVSDHMRPTDTMARPYEEAMAEIMVSTLETNCRDFGIRHLVPERGEQGICHVVGPELGLTQPGITMCAGDSHTSTHGAFGVLAFGIGASQICDVLATQTLAVSKLKVRRIVFKGRLRPGVYAKDVAMYMIHELGVKGGVGYAYEYAGEVIDRFSMEERMTLCNMSIEGGARCGYVNPDQTTYAYLRNREYAPGEQAFAKAIEFWESVKSDVDAHYDDVVEIDVSNLKPYMTWGITLGHSVPIGEPVPTLESLPQHEQIVAAEAYQHMGFAPGTQLLGQKIDAAFIGSCTNGRYSDFVDVGEKLKSSGHKVASHVKALAVPGSQEVYRELVANGYDKIFQEAGFELREVGGCSMCIGMNPDHLVGNQLCVASSNRNFKGRQGSPTGRTILMSPVSVAACAVKGCVADPAEVFTFDNQEVSRG